MSSLICGILGHKGVVNREANHDCQPQKRNTDQIQKFVDIKSSLFVDLSSR